MYITITTYTHLDKHEIGRDIIEFIQKRQSKHCWSVAALKYNSNKAIKHG